MNLYTNKRRVKNKWENQTGPVLAAVCISSSVKRHIQNIHSGDAHYVSFIDYLAGKKSGFYWPVLPPTYQNKNGETNNKKRT